METLRSSGDVPRDKLLVIDNGVDLERFQVDDAQRIEARARLGIPEAAFVIGSVGRLAPEKNYGFLMRAAEPLLSSGAHLVFVGDGSERGRLEAQAAASRRPAAVHFAGAQSDVATFLAAMDVFSLSSTFEGLPLALLEAMACGRTVVASAIGGIPLVVEDGSTGLLVASGDEAGFTAALRRVRDDKASGEIPGRGRTFPGDRTLWPAQNAGRVRGPLSSGDGLTCGLEEELAPLSLRLALLYRVT